MSQTTTRIAFTVPAVPVAQPRQRHRVVEANGRTFATNYTPAKHPANEFKASVRMAARAALGEAPVIGQPVALSVLFVFPRPASMCWKKRPQPRAPHCKRPDVENLLKSLMDSLSQTVIRDDAQICQVTARKVIAAGDEAPRCEVTLEVLE